MCVCIVSKAIGAWGVIQSICVGVYCSDTHTHMLGFDYPHAHVCMYVCISIIAQQVNYQNQINVYTYIRVCACAARTRTHTHT